MIYTTIISAKELRSLIDYEPRLIILDCSFQLDDPSAGRQTHILGHIPKSQYVHLDEILSGPRTGANGRHPLPPRETFAEAMATFGTDDDTQIIAYDNAFGMYAARLWWMLRWAGHASVAVLDGGIDRWRQRGYEIVNTTAPARSRGRFSLREPLTSMIDFNDVIDNFTKQTYQIIDARSADRFRGENETIDPIGGHIPGAYNRPYTENLTPDGHFKSASQLREEFGRLIEKSKGSRIISQCGSGVTACHNLLAMEIGGYTDGALYPGSWSEYCTHPGAIIAVGDERD